jgi:hypothetical protein
MHEEGNILDEHRDRRSEEAIRESLAIIRSLNASVVNTSDKEMTSQSTSVTIAIAGVGGEAMSGSNRSVSARDITGSSVVTGDHNTVATTMRQVPLPPADQVDVKAELAALREALAALNKVPDRGKLDRALEDAAEEAEKPEPDKEEVGGALGRVVKYAKAADDFGDHAEKLLPRLAALAAWLGPVGHSLLSMVGLSS